MRDFAVKNPKELVNLFIYIQARKQKELWYRVYIKEYIEAQKYFDCEYQNTNKTSKKVRLENEMFLIDQRSKDEIKSKGNKEDFTLTQCNNKKKVLKIIQREFEG